jgi:hypothetical protein
MSHGLEHLLHASIFGIVLYLIMVFILGQKSETAESRSILISSLVLVYMVMYGHGLPLSINRNLL